MEVDCLANTVVLACLEQLGAPSVKNLTRDMSIHQHLTGNLELTTDDPFCEHVDTEWSKNDNHHHHEAQTCSTPRFLTIFYNDSGTGDC